MKRLIQVVIAGIVTVGLFVSLVLCILVWKVATLPLPGREAQTASRLQARGVIHISSPDRANRVPALVQKEGRRKETLSNLARREFTKRLL